MNIKKIFGVLAIILVVSMAGLTSCAGMSLQDLQGVLKNVDSVSGNVTVTMSDGTTKTFNLSDIDMAALKENLDNISLEIGDNVTVKQDNHGKIRGMAVRFAEADGIIKSTDNTSITITTDDNKDITLKVVKGALIIVKATGTVPFTTLTVGQRVEARYDINTMQAIKIKVDFYDNGKHGEAYGKLEGVIKNISSDNTSVVITTKNNGDMTVKIAPATIIAVQGKCLAVFADLKAGQQVDVKYDPSNMQAIRIMVQNEKINKAQKQNLEKNQIKEKNQKQKTSAQNHMIIGKNGNHGRQGK